MKLYFDGIVYTSPMGSCNPHVLRMQPVLVVPSLVKPGTFNARVGASKPALHHDTIAAAVEHAASIAYGGQVNCHGIYSNYR